MSNTDYELRTENDKLIFSTLSFRAEKSSVLHSGVYTKEFTSMLFASAIAVIAYVATGKLEEFKNMRYLLIILIFILIFITSRKFIFKEKHLKVDFNRGSKTVNIIHPGILLKKYEAIPFADITAVEIGSRKFEPDNIDGIRFVQKISLQHGSAMPELSQAEEYITLSLKLTDGSERIIYAGRIEDEPELPVNEMKNYLGI